MVSEVVAFVLLSAAMISASALIAGYMASAASDTAARINEQAHRQVLMLSESLSVTGTYTCGGEWCVDVMNNSGRPVGISYAYDGSTGSAIPYRIMDASGQIVSKLPTGAGTIALAPSTLTSAVLVSENFVVYRVA
jgi:hypothetical protein